MRDWKRSNPLTLTLSQRERGSSPRLPLPPSPIAGEGPFLVIVFAPFSPCGRRVGDEGALADGTAGAVQDARAGPSTGFRPPFGLGRVTFLCVAKEKSPKERPPPPIRPLRGCPQFRANVGRAAADGTSLMASLTLPLTLGGLEGDQNRAHLRLGCLIRNSGMGWNSTSKRSASRVLCRSSSTTSAPSC